MRPLHSAFSALGFMPKYLMRVAKIERLEAFASHLALTFMLPRIQELSPEKKEPWTIPESIPVQHSAASLKPLCGESR